MLHEMMRTLLKQAGQGNGASGATVEMLQASWSTLVGPELARRSWPVRWEAGRLEVEVATHTWHQELSLRKEELRRRIQRYLPWPVRSLGLRLGDQSMEHVAMLEPREPARAHLGSPQQDDRALPEDLQLALGQLDEELQHTLLRIRANIAASPPLRSLSVSLPPKQARGCMRLRGRDPARAAAGAAKREKLASRAIIALCTLSAAPCRTGTGPATLRRSARGSTTRRRKKREHDRVNAQGLRLVLPQR